MIGRWPALAGWLAVGAALGTAAADAPRSRDFELTYTARIGELPAGAHRGEVWLPYPASDGSQEVTVAAMSTPAAYEVVKEPRFGNSILHLSVTDPRDRELAVEMKVRVRRREYIRRDFAGAAGQTPAAVPAAAASTAA
jgi:hypothetical protein